LKGVQHAAQGSRLIINFHVYVDVRFGLLLFKDKMYSYGQVLSGYIHNSMVEIPIPLLEFINIELANTPWQGTMSGQAAYNGQF